ncbi:MAG: hypothetical protein RL632_44 [Bacteroidota bacterium]|jgi:hypothetical protein
MHYLRIIPLILLVFACRENATCKDCASCGKDLNVHQETLAEAIERKEGGVSKQDDLQDDIEKIEAEYGEQWDFCDCVVKGDSLNTAISAGKLSDAAFERLSKRFDEIELRCKVFKMQDPNRTPDERLAHEKKVQDCLENFGDK